MYSINKKILLVASLLVYVVLSSCDKDDAEIMSDYDNNKINLVVADNFNLSSFSASLRRSNLDRVLQAGDGPYTLFAPSDAAFVSAGYNNPVSVMTALPAVVSRIANYHTLDGTFELNKLPYLFNQELKSRGGKLYATHWIKGQDTVLTINGSRVLAKNIPASNGIIQVIDRVLTPYMHDKISDAIVAEESITLFAQAMKVSGVMEEVNKEGPFTVFAPNNQAMQNYGYGSLHAINNADPTELKTVIDYHIIRNRRFIYDYILSAGPTNSSKQAMLDHNLITIKLIANADAPGGFSGITLRGIGNTAEVNVLKQDLLTGNGVLHVIDQVLRITQ